MRKNGQVRGWGKEKKIPKLGRGSFVVQTDFSVAKPLQAQKENRFK